MIDSLNYPTVSRGDDRQPVHFSSIETNCKRNFYFPVKSRRTSRTNMGNLLTFVWAHHKRDCVPLATATSTTLFVPRIYYMAR